MWARLLTFSLVCVYAAPTQAAQTVPFIEPGIYGASFTCPGSAPVPVIFYVLNEYEDRGYKFDKTQYQRIRVQAGDSLFSGSAILNGMNQVRVIVTEWEKTSTKGFGAYPDTYDFSGRFESMQGTAWASKEITVAGGGRARRAVDCSLRADQNAARNAKPLADMTHAVQREPVVIDHSQHRGGVPSPYAVFTPDPGAARALGDAVASTISDDSQSWLLHRLRAGTVGDFHFFRESTDPSRVYAWASYTYISSDGWDTNGWAAVRFTNGTVECIQYHNKSSCTRPRISRSAQMVRLGDGRSSLPAIRVAPTCFKQATRMEQRSREVVVYADRRGDVDTKTEYYSVPVNYTVFTCASQSYEFECVAEGVDRVTEWMVGVGTTLKHPIVLTQAQETGFTAADMERFNRRIADKSCVRIK